MALEIDEIAGPDGGNESSRLAKYWLDQIYAVKDNSEYKRWVKRGEDIVKRYRDERDRVDQGGARRYNSLWSNVEILKPALYGRMPQPVAERRFRDKDPVGRAASQILERALRNEIEICGYDDALSRAVSDYLLPGRGTVWVRYEPKIEESTSLPPSPEIDIRDSQGEIGGDETEGMEDSSGDAEAKPKRERPRINENKEDAEFDDKQGAFEGEGGGELTAEAQKLEDTDDRVIRESTPVDFIPWEDFFVFPVRSRTWNEVQAVCKRVYMSRDQMVRRFGKKIGKHIPLDKDSRGDRIQNTTLQAADQDKGQVYEIWSKEDQTVYWVAIGYDYLCDRKEDPLGLEGFWPTPRPLFSNATNNTLFPVPDYIQYQDQAIQIDELTMRIAMLSKACKMAGVYNAAAKDIQRLYQESVENQMIPVDDWAAFSEKGGVEGNLSFIPVKDTIGIINELTMVKQKQIEEMDRLTGITDVLRGTTDARETLGGVRLKTNSAGTRLTSRQNEVARFARDTVRIMADIMCQHFSPQSLIEVSGALYEEGLGPDDMPTLSALNGPSQQPLPQPQQSGAPLQVQKALPPPVPQQPPSPPMGAGGNVVPFRPPMGQQPSAPPVAPPPQNGPPQQPPMAPGGPPGMPPGMIPPMALPQPQISPEDMAKLAALQRITKAIALLRDERLRGFRVDIEVDSTIFPDAAQEKQDRTEFITSITQFLQTSMAMGAQMPESIPLLGKLLQFGVRGYRVGRDLEMSIEEFTDKAAFEARDRMVQQSQNNPQMMKNQIDMQKAQAQLQSQQISAETDKMRAAAEIQAAQAKAVAEEKSSQAEIQRQQIENSGEAANSQADIQTKQMDVQMRQMELEIEKLHLQIELAKMHAQINAPRPAVSGSEQGGI